MRCKCHEESGDGRLINPFKLFQHPQGLVDLTPDMLEKRLEEGPIVVDVRTPREYESGHIKGAISHPLGQERELREKWPADADIVLICKTGHRSQAAASTLLSFGYNRVAHLQGGMDSWKKAGKPLE